MTDIGITQRILEEQFPEACDQVGPSTVAAPTTSSENVSARMPTQSTRVTRRSDNASENAATPEDWFTRTAIGNPGPFRESQVPQPSVERR